MSDIRFDMRLERAAHRIADEAVRPIDAVAIAESAMRAAARTRELSTPFLRQSRAWAAAVAAGLVIVVGASVLLGDRSRSDVGGPSASASPTPLISPSPTPAPTASDPTPGGTWLADIPDSLAFAGSGTPRRMTLTVASGPIAAIDLVGGSAGLFQSSFETFGVGEVRYTTSATVVADADHAAGDAVAVDGVPVEGCSAGDEGHYQTTSSADGLVLGLTAISDECPSRQAVLGRSWTRSIAVANGGGIGVVDAFDPLFTLVLPAGSYVVDRNTDSLMIFQDLPELQFHAFKDPQGFIDPCDRSAGRRTIAPGADAVVAYFRQLAGFTVDSTSEVMVDGYRAVRLVVHADEDASCPDGRLWEWQPKAQTGDAAWFVRPGVTDSLYIVDHPAGTVMFELLPAPNPLEQQVIGSIRFLDALPTTP